MTILDLIGVNPNSDGTRMKKHPNPWLDSYWQKPDRSRWMEIPHIDRYLVRGLVVVILFVTGVGVLMSMPL